MKVFAVFALVALSLALVGCTQPAADETSTTYGSVTTTVSSSTSTTDAYTEIEKEFDQMGDEDMSDLEQEISK